MNYECDFCGWIDGEHAPECLYEYEQVIYHTQGGGEVEWNGVWWVFVKNPPSAFEIGDYMPKEWGIA